MGSRATEPIGAANLGGRALRADPTATLRQICKTFAAENVDAVLLDRPGSPVAVVTVRDLARALAEGADPDVVWGADVTAPHPCYTLASTPVMEVITEMLRNQVDHILVMDEDGLVGMANLRSLVGEVVTELADQTAGGSGSVDSAVT